MRTKRPGSDLDGLKDTEDQRFNMSALSRSQSKHQLRGEDRLRYMAWKSLLVVRFVKQLVQRCRQVVENAEIILLTNEDVRRAEVLVKCGSQAIE